MPSLKRTPPAAPARATDRGSSMPTQVFMYGITLYGHGERNEFSAISSRPCAVRSSFGPPWPLLTIARSELDTKFRYRRVHQPRTLLKLRPRLVVSSRRP